MDYFVELFFEVVPFAVIVGTVYVVFRALRLKRRGLSRDNWLRELVRLAFVCYMAGLLGLLLPLRWPQLTVPKALGIGVCVDLVIEVVQPMFGRSFDLEDLICNALGVLLGLGACLLFRLAAPKFVRSCQGEG